MQQNDLNEHPQEQAPARADDLGQATSSASKTDRRRRKATAILLLGDAVQLLLFGLLAMSIHIHPLLPIDIAITHSFQQNQAPWLRVTMLAISYPGSSFLLPALVVLTVVIFWSLGDRLVLQQHICSQASCSPFDMSLFGPGLMSPAKA